MPLAGVVPQRSGRDGIILFRVAKVHRAWSPKKRTGKRLDQSSLSSLVSRDQFVHLAAA
jgi:hypothetical protein